MTGGAGFVGTNLVKSLANLDYEVVVVDDFSTGLRKNLDGVNCEIHEFSINNYAEVYSAFKDCGYIFHLGARGSVPRSIQYPRETYDVNVLGTLNLLECARTSGATIAFSSSSSVYGSNQELPKTEKMWLSPLSPYAASKLSAEVLVQSYSNSYKLSAVTYRFFNIYGPWQRPDHDYAAVIPKWIWKILHGQSIDVYGDGSQSRDFTYIDNVVEVLISGMKFNLNHPSPINLAYGDNVSLNRLLSILKMKFSDFKIEYSEARKGDVMHSQNNPRLLKELFPNIHPIEFEHGLNETINWLTSYSSEFSTGKFGQV